jgi:hypothetical protein
LVPSSVTRYSSQIASLKVKPPGSTHHGEYSHGRIVATKKAQATKGGATIAGVI